MASRPAMRPRKDRTLCLGTPSHLAQGSSPAGPQVVTASLIRNEANLGNLAKA